MPEYLSPGVYVEEVDAGPKPIEGVSTSTAGMVGVTARGPTSGAPQLVTSFPDFVRKFGGYLPEPSSALVNKWALNDEEGGRWWLFPLAVQGFFNNGGQRLYVKRAVAAGAVAASGRSGRGVIAELAADAAMGATQLSLRHLIGLDVGDTVQLFRGDSGAQVGGNFTVQGYDAGKLTVTLDAGLPEALKKARDFVQIRPLSASPVPAPEVTLTFQAKAKGAWGDAIQARVRPMVGATYNILPDPGTGPLVLMALSQDVAAAATSILVDAPAPITAPARIAINGREYQVDTVTPDANPANPVTLTLNAATPIAENLSAGTAVKQLRAANPAPGAKIYLKGGAALYKGAIVELDDGTSKEIRIVNAVDGDQVTFNGNLTGSYFEGHRARVVEAEVAVSYAANGDLVEEAFGSLRLVKDGSASSLIEHINTQSTLVSATEGANYSESDLAKFPAVAGGGWLTLSGGNDDLNSLSVDDFVGQDGGSGNRTGIQAMEDIDEISICMVPGVWSRTVQSALIGHCELLKDRFAVVDPKDGLSIEGIRSFREPIDTKYGALYYPWLLVRDPSVQRNVACPPSGHVAGVYARVDVERGVHKAPANEVIRGIAALAQNVVKREQDMLNPKNINVLRDFPGRGRRVWGARVLTSDAAWKYINVRRLFIMIEESIDEGTQWVVFEPNDEPLWARVRQTITNFLTTQWRNGALQGSTADEAFFVKCDRSTMTQDDIDNGRLICVIGIAPVKPAEFVIFRIQQKTLDAQAS